MENFWWGLGGHYNPQTAQLFYATQAWADTHAVGRVTCPLTGSVSADGHNPHVRREVHVRPGFFVPRSVRDPHARGMSALRDGFSQGMTYLANTQCDTPTAAERAACLDDVRTLKRPHPIAGPEAGNVCGYKATGGVRHAAGVNETNLNTLGGVCNLPQQFHGMPWSRPTAAPRNASCATPPVPPLPRLLTVARLGGAASLLTAQVRSPSGVRATSKT
jgi:hypothetical protein